MEVHSLHFWFEHTKAYTGVYSMTHLMNKDVDIHEKVQRLVKPFTHRLSLTLPFPFACHLNPTHILSASPSRSSLFPRGALYAHRFIPISHFSVVRPTSAMRRRARTTRRRRRSDAGVQTASGSSARVFSSLALHVTIAHIYLSLTCSHANCTCMFSYGSPPCISRVSRAYFRTRLYRDPSSSGSLTRAKEQVQRPGHIARRVPSSRSRRTGYYRTFRLPLPGFKL